MKWDFSNKIDWDKLPIIPGIEEQKRVSEFITEFDEYTKCLDDISVDLTGIVIIKSKIDTENWIELIIGGTKFISMCWCKSFHGISPHNLYNIDEIKEIFDFYYDVR